MPIATDKTVFKGLLEKNAQKPFRSKIFHNNIILAKK